MKKKNKYRGKVEAKPDEVGVLDPEGDPIGKPVVTAADVPPESAAAGNASPSAAPVAELQERIEKLTDGLARAKADFSNLQRRSAIDRAEARRYANADVMKSLLGVLDDFDRALTAADTTKDFAALVQGVRLMHQNLLGALSAHGLDPIDALHQAFDPSVHEALVQRPSDTHSPGTVIEQVSRGYRLHDRLLRPARVVVAKAVEHRAAENAAGGTPPRGDVEVDGHQ